MPVRSKGDAGLSRAERYSRPDYRRTFDEGKSFPSRFVVLWVLPGEPDGPARLGTVVSKKTFPHAVERNRARRLMRESFRLSKGGVRNGFLLMAVGRRRLVGDGVKCAEVRADFVRACRKAGVWEGGAT